jgi:hypothetical protein
VRSAIAHALTLGAESGPTMPDLGPTTTDGCHANAAGKALLGQALLDWEALQEPSKDFDQETDYFGMPGGGPRCDPRLAPDVGCSMTRDTFTGYEEIGANLAWPVGTYNLSSGVLGAWVVRGSRWRGDRNGNFEGHVQKRNAQAPAAVLIMVCANTKTSVKVTDMEKVIGNLAYFSPGVDVYLTSQPRYIEGHLCTNLATSLSSQESQFAAIDAVIAAAIANDWAEARPCRS